MAATRDEMVASTASRPSRVMAVTTASDEHRGDLISATSRSKQQPLREVVSALPHRLDLCSTIWKHPAQRAGRWPLYIRPSHGRIDRRAVQRAQYSLPSTPV